MESFYFKIMMFFILNVDDDDIHIFKLFLYSSYFSYN